MKIGREKSLETTRLCSLRNLTDGGISAANCKNNLGVKIVDNCLAP